MARLNSAGVMSSKRANTDENAALTHTSIGPISRSIRSTAAATWSGSATSVGTVDT